MYEFEFRVFCVVLNTDSMIAISKHLHLLALISKQCNTIKNKSTQYFNRIKKEEIVTEKEEKIIDELSDNDDNDQQREYEQRLCQCKKSKIY